MRGIIAAAGYLPHWRLERSAISEVLGSSAGKGSRSVASYDEDSLTLAVAAARDVLRDNPAPVSLWFATTSPTYLEKTNATIAHAALRLDPTVIAADAAGGLRGASAALRSALRSTEEADLVIAGDVRTGMAGSPEESGGGDAGSALLIGDGDESSLAAQYLGGASATREFLDAWRVPGELRTRHWEERFGQQRYAELAEAAWEAALKDAGVDPERVAAVAVSTPTPRAAAGLSKKLGAAGIEVLDGLAGTVGFSGAAHPGLLLTSLIENAEAGQVVALVVMADGADVFLFRVTDRAAAMVATRPTVAEQFEATAELPYSKYLAWRGVLPQQPPNRPEPARMSASAAERRLDWKYGFVGSRDRDSDALHLPPARVSFVGGNVDDMDPAPMADVPATIATYTIDRLAYSPSPPIVFAIADFEGGGRLPVELTDVRPDEVRLGMTVQMTFRRLNTADGIANYFWKARPAPSTAADAGAARAGSN